MLLALASCSAWWSASLGFSSRSYSSVGPSSAWTQGNASQNLALLAAHPGWSAPARDAGRLVYPYSVIPGGVRTPRDLHEVSQHDRVVARHFAGFDFQRAKVVELDQAKLVYVSYRIHDQVFWTRKQTRLRKGEKLITDGKITARTRCANRVSALPQHAVSPEEPLAERFEEPIAGGGSAVPMAFPGNFDSALLTRPEPPGFGPEGPSPGSPFGPTGGAGVPGFFSPPLPAGSCETAVQEAAEGKHEKQLGILDEEKKEKHCAPGRPPAPVPEPGTILLVSSGMTGVYLRYRRAGGKS
jgi:PEP-CTERM motif